MIIDTHSHLNFKAFDNDWESVLKRAFDNEISVINAGSQYETSKKAVEIAEKYEKNVFAAIGLHPIHAKENFNIEEYKKLAESKKVVAIGEIGLDYFKDYGVFKEEQKEIFLNQLDLAEGLNLPVILHCRMAHGDLIEALKGRESRIKGVIHCFTGTWEEAKQYLDMGFYLGFNGIIYKFDLKEVIEKIPIDRILLETDSPYLIPAGIDAERNEPVFIKKIAEDVAKIRGITFEELAEKTAENARKIFNL